MNVIKKKCASEHSNASTCAAHEYDTGTPDINIARVEVNGRYPENGTAANTNVTELAYVAAGSGVLCCEKVCSELSEGDVVSIAPGEHVYWEGQLTLVMACSPAWYPEQYEQHP